MSTRGDELDGIFDTTVPVVTLQQTPNAFGHGRVAAARSSRAASSCVGAR